MRAETRKIWASWMVGLGLLVAHGAKADSVTYVYTDPQGTPLAEADQSGTITATFDYAPYGSQAMGTPPDGPGYTGHVNDPDTGLVYMQARYYDPAVGRFLSEDPVGPAAGNVFNVNRYAYANNNPVVNMDPDGRCTGTHICNGDGTAVSTGEYTTKAGNTHSLAIHAASNEAIALRGSNLTSTSIGSAGTSMAFRGGCCGSAGGGGAGDDEDQGEEQAKSAGLAMISEARLLNEAGYLGKGINASAVLEILDEAGSGADLATTIGGLSGGFLKSELANADEDIRTYRQNLISMGPGKTGVYYYGFVQWGLHYNWSKFDPGLDNSPSQILHNLFWAASQL